MDIWACPKCTYRTEQPEGIVEMSHACGLKRVPVWLAKITPPKVNIRAGIVAASNAQFPEEACGFILSSGDLVLAENAAEDPKQNFRIDDATADLWWPSGRVSGVWHSHCFDPAVPSDADESQAMPGLECWIYSVMDEQLGIYKPDRSKRLQLISMEDIE